MAPFSHAVETDGFVFVTGQMPDTPDAPGQLPDTIEAQTRAVMENLRLVLAGLDLGFEHVVMARIYLTRFKQDYAAVNEVYRSYFAEGRLPARTCIGVTGTHKYRRHSCQRACAMHSRGPSPGALTISLTASSISVRLTFAPRLRRDFLYS